jgi:hypothetical protein
VVEIYDLIVIIPSGMLIAFALVFVRRRKRRWPREIEIGLWFRSGPSSGAAPLGRQNRPSVPMANRGGSQAQLRGRRVEPAAGPMAARPNAYSEGESRAKK